VAVEQCFTAFAGPPSEGGSGLFLESLRAVVEEEGWLQVTALLLENLNPTVRRCHLLNLVLRF